MVNIVRGRECFVGLSILLVYNSIGFNVAGGEQAWERVCPGGPSQGHVPVEEEQCNIHHHYQK